MKNELEIIILFVLGLTALASHFNDRILKLNKTMGLTIFSILISLVFILILKITVYTGNNNYFINRLYDQIKNINFQDIVLNYMLGYLLFATALHTNILDFKNVLKKIIYLISLGMVVNTLLIGLLSYLFFKIIGLNIDFGICLIFGALISPTDPVVVLSMLKNNRISEKVKNTIIGESLFNDASAILLLTILVGFFIQNNLTSSSVYHIILNDIFLSLLISISLAFVLGNFIIMRIKSETTGLFFTLFGSSLMYFICLKYKLSIALSMVIFGLITGYFIKKTKIETNNINYFWNTIDDILNSCLFILIGLKILVISINLFWLFAGVVVLIITLLSRYLSILFTHEFYQDNLKKYFIKKETIIMTLGGVRGGISIALVLSIENAPNQLLYLTYSVVVLSIILQGLSFDKYLSSINNKIVIKN